MTATTANGIRIEYETFGVREQPPLLLVMGLGAQMIAWDEAFCRDLAARGFFVIRFDNRDAGKSQWLDELGTPDVGAAMAAAAAGSTPLTIFATWPPTGSGCSPRSASNARTSLAPRWAA